MLLQNKCSDGIFVPLGEQDFPKVLCSRSSWRLMLKSWFGQQTINFWNYATTQSLEATKTGCMPGIFLCLNHLVKSNVGQVTAANRCKIAAIRAGLNYQQWWTLMLYRVSWCCTIVGAHCFLIFSRWGAPVWSPPKSGGESVEKGGRIEHKKKDPSKTTIRHPTMEDCKYN